MQKSDSYKLTNWIKPVTRHTAAGKCAGHWYQSKRSSEVNECVQLVDQLVVKLKKETNEIIDTH